VGRWLPRGGGWGGAGEGGWRMPGRLEIRGAYGEGLGGGAFVSARRDSFPDRATTPETNFFSLRDDGTRSWEHSFPLPLSHPLGGRDEPPCLTFANPPQQLISPKRPALRHPPSPIGYAQIPGRRKQGRSGSLCATDFQPHPSGRQISRRSTCGSGNCERLPGRANGTGPFFSQWNAPPRLSACRTQTGSRKTSAEVSAKGQTTSA